MKATEIFKDILSDKEKLELEVSKSFSDLYNPSVPTDHKDNIRNFITEIIWNFEKDLLNEINSKKHNPNNLIRSMQSVTEKNTELFSDLQQTVQILYFLQKTLLKKITQMASIRTIDYDLIYPVINVIGNAISYFCKRSDKENSRINLRNKSIIDNLKIVKNDLQNQLDTMYHIVKNTPIGLAGCDSDLKVKLWNPIAANITGYQQNDIIGKNLLNILSEPSKQVFLNQLQNIHKKIKRIKLNIQTRDGGIFNAFVLINSFNSEIKQNISYIINFIDMRKDEKIKSQLEKIDQLGAVARLSDAIMHDVRNPINSLALNIDVLTQIISGSSVYNVDVKKILDKINGQIYNLDQNLNQYVGYSKITELHSELINIKDLLETILLDARFKISNRNIAVKYNHSKNKILIYGDKNLLLRVFRNIIDNAIDAIDETGTINITIRKSNKKLNISIIDNGRGISPDNLQNIFRPYFTNKIKGTGLGLFIVREIIHAHNGKIHCTSEINKGTQFTVSLPIEPKRVQTSE